METTPFWRERESRFAALETYPGAAFLHATPTHADAGQILEKFAELTREAMLDPALPPNLAYSRAHTLGRAGRILLDGEKADRWFICADTHNDTVHRELNRRWRAEAAMAAVGADVADASMTEQTAVEVWLDLLVSRNSPHSSGFGIINHLVRASALMCAELASEVYRMASGSQARTVTVERQKAFPKRADWLRRQVADRGISRNRLHDLGGPDAKTTDRILLGKPVQTFVLDKLANALDLHDVQMFLGHAAITTTSRYLQSTPVRLERALARLEAAATASDSHKSGQKPPAEASASRPEIATNLLN